MGGKQNKDRAKTGQRQTVYGSSSFKVKGYLCWKAK